MSCLVYYVSGHGFGHAVRSGLVQQALHALRPDLRIIVRTDRPPWLFPPNVEVAPVTVDVGIVQSDSLTPLLTDTLDAATRFEAERPNLVRREAAVLKTLAPIGIVSDIPPLAFDVAANLGVPSIAIGNFSWDWIYRGLGVVDARVDELASAVVASQRQASLLLRLPMHGDMSAFPRIEDVPLIAKKSTADRSATRSQLGIAPGATVALLSFGGHELLRLDFDALASLSPIMFVITAPPPGPLPPNVILGPRDPATYPDLLAASNVVVMKPGYGTVADCLVNQVPMIYTTRPGFVEENVLVQAMLDWGRAVPIAQDDLLAGRLGEPIGDALALSKPWQPLAANGAEVAARRILGLLAPDTCHAI